MTPPSGIISVMNCCELFFRPVCRAFLALGFALIGMGDPAHAQMNRRNTVIMTPRNASKA